MPSTTRLSHRHQPSTTSTTSSTSSSSSTRPALQRILTNSPSNAVHLSRSTARTSRRVRSHWFSHFALNWRRSSRSSKLFLASSMTFMAVQVIASIIVLTFSWEMYCDKPLRIFITVYLLRLILSCPLTVYLHLVPRRQQQLQQQQQQQSQPQRSAESRAEAGEMYPMTHITRIPPALSSSASTSLPQHIPQAPPPNMHRTSRPESHYPDTILTHWIDRAKSALDMFGLLWFIIGNYMLFTSSTCSETAVPLYYLSLVVIIYNYVIISVPIFLCTAVIFCLPCVLVGMRIIHVQDAVDMGGASVEEMATIPVYQFKANKPSSAPSPNVTSEEIEIHELPKKPVVVKQDELSFLDQLWIRIGLVDNPNSSPHEEEPEFDTIEIPNEQDQVCAICLSTYDDGDILCQLWCNHHFHRTCVHEWLVLNSRCPMCKRDCRGKPRPPEDALAAS
ncbi:hypothetical protein BJV82DRAFT_618356 [Fennellomyces sp. T-0311]|nr:hypothetical protein BJV82DRAFT_618356 [Fennellomyces sp. T-0311]